MARLLDYPLRPHRAVFPRQRIRFIRRLHVVLRNGPAMRSMLLGFGLSVRLRMLFIKFGRRLPRLPLFPQFLRLLSIMVSQPNMIVGMDHALR